ncbi:MAG: GreA/GreB family elongation factor [Polyangiaceae bacterium]
MLDKAALRDRLISTLEDALERAQRAQRTSQEGVTHEDARAEGDKDMRATEASYVARGQAMRVESLEADLAKVRSMKLRAFAAEAPIALGAIVVVETDQGERRTLFVAPAGGGSRIAVDGGEVRVVTPSSPLGKSLLGATVGDAVRFERGDQPAEELEIVNVE